jgi:ssDNA-specific exonuclease RecJ
MPEESINIKRNIDDKSTWAYPDIPSGITIIRKIRKKHETDEVNVYKIYKECIEIQRAACIRKQKEIHE